MGSGEPGPCLTDKRAFGSQPARFLVTLVVSADQGDLSSGRKLGGRFGVVCQLTELREIRAMSLWMKTAIRGALMLLKLTIGVRVSEEEEQLGLDRADTGVEAYPEFAV